jgi:hypothetical protein
MDEPHAQLPGGGFEMRIAGEDPFIVISRRDHDEQFPSATLIHKKTECGTRRHE